MTRRGRIIIFYQEEDKTVAFKELYQPVHTIIGEGCIHEIPRHISSFGGTKALVVTDPGLEKIGTLKMVTDVLDA